MGLIWLAGIWGLAEASFFFLVPDVLLSAMAVTSLRRALWGVAAALAGALIGGVCCYYWGVLDPIAACHFVESVPAISQQMMAKVSAELQNQGAGAVLFGPLSGTPYKTYAVQAAGTGLSVVAFLLISVPARLLRFVLVTLVSYGIGRWCLRRLPYPWKMACWAGTWLAFYLYYFSVMPG